MRDQDGEVHHADRTLPLVLRVAVGVVVQNVAHQEDRRRRECRHHQALVKLTTTAANRREAEHQGDDRDDGARQHDRLRAMGAAGSPTTPMALYAPRTSASGVP